MNSSVDSRRVGGASKFFKVVEIRLVIFYSIFITFPVEIASLEASVSTAFDLFPDCHLRFISGLKELVPDRMSYLVSINLGRNLTFSNFVHGQRNFSQEVRSYRKRSPHVALKFTQTLVHLYMEDEITRKG